MELEIHLLEIQLIGKVGGAGDTFVSDTHVQLIGKVDGAVDTFVRDTTECKSCWSVDPFVRDATDWKSRWSWRYIRLRYN